MKILKALVLGLLLAGIVGFSIQNAGLVRLRYFGFIDSFQVPLFLLVLLSITLGLFVGSMVDLVKRRRLGKVIRKQEKTAEALRGEIRAFRDKTFTEVKTEERH